MTVYVVIYYWYDFREEGDGQRIDCIFKNEDEADKYVAQKNEYLDFRDEEYCVWPWELI